MGLSVIHWSVECEMRSVVYGPPIEEEEEMKKDPLTFIRLLRSEKSINYAIRGFKSPHLMAVNLSMDI